MSANVISEGYRPIRVVTLRGDLKITFDVFVRVGEKHILYCRNGDSFEGSRLDRLQTKKLATLFIRNDDEPAYRRYLDESINRAYDNAAGKPIELRAQVIQGFQQALTEDYFESPVDQDSYHQAHTSLERFTNFLKAEPQGFKALLETPNADKNISHHGVNVAALSIMIARDAGVADAQLHLLGLGGHFHDIDHYFTKLNVGRPLAEMSPDDKKIYLRHPVDGGHRLQDVKFLDQLVLKIITQHEENAKGTGFPQGLNDKQMDPLVLIAATANAYDRLVSFEGMKPKDALKFLLVENIGLYPLNYLQSLQNLLKKSSLI